MNRQFWQGKRVFLTGHTGFKGGWLSLWLQQMGAQVTGYSLEAPTTPSLFEVANVAEGMTSLQGDIREFEPLCKAVTTHQPDIVIHMAAQPLVRYSYDNPIETYATNVMGTVHLLEAVRKTPSVKAVVCITTDKCYENREWDWGYRENDPMGGHDPYSSSKGCAELVIASLRRSYFHLSSYSEHGVGVASVRAGNVIGGGDWALDRLVPDILKAFGNGEPVVLRSPGAIRPWQHVLEPLGGYLLLAQCLYEKGAAYADAWNFGPRDEDARPVSWIVDTLSRLWGEGATWKIDDKPQPHEAHFLKLDCSKAANQLHWRPQLALEHALKLSVEWYQAFLSGQDMHAMTLKQISQYEDILGQ